MTGPSSVEPSVHASGRSGGVVRRSRTGGMFVGVPLVLALWLRLLQGRVLGEDQVAARYEDYAEQNGRIHIETYGLQFEKAVAERVVVAAGLIYDGISGATPTGAPPPPGSDQVPTVEVADIRRAVAANVVWTPGRYTFTPQVAYSKEDDYQSVGVALTGSRDFNEKNTTATLGLAHDFDRILPNAGTWLAEPADKDNTDVILGVTQLLGPKTKFTAALTLGYSDGYLTDPYKSVVFPAYDPETLFPEQRPGHKFRQVVQAVLTHYISPLAGSLETTLRLHYDSFGVTSQTAALAWNQKVGRHVVISPLFRYYHQSAASFYGTEFPGDPFTTPELVPPYYSADFRLSRLQSFSYGIALTARLHEHLSLDAGYKRYVMEGLDGVTSPSAYPTANVISAGLRFWF